MSSYRRADSVFQRISRATQVFTEFGWRKFINQAMPIAVRTDFVPTVVDLPHQPRIALGNPAKDEKSGIDFMAVQQLQHSARISLHTALPVVPMVPMDVLLKCGDLIIILHIH